MTSIITRAQQFAALRALGIDWTTVARVEIDLSQVTVEGYATIDGKVKAGDDGEAARTVTVIPIVGRGEPLRDCLDEAAVHKAFGLSYANYLVWPRTLMQSMPAVWQSEFVALMDEFEQAFAHVDQADSYIVTAATECTYSDLTDEDMKDLGITCNQPEDDYATYWDRDGTERESGDRIYVPIRNGDPVPHYNRGRTRIEPQTSAPAPDVPVAPAGMRKLLGHVEANLPRTVTTSIQFDDSPGARQAMAALREQHLRRPAGPMQA